jgi:UDP-GlcNAc:undecaprenyl-phosphate GlcNAc-1-phosphate transferase
MLQAREGVHSMTGFAGALLTAAVVVVLLRPVAGRIGVTGAGAVCGFLVHNVAPARSFLGDSGSLMLGALLVLTWAPGGPAAVLLGCLVPLADTAFVVSRRLLAGRKPWIGGTDHSGHALLRAGVGPRMLAAGYAATSACAGTLAHTFGHHAAPPARRDALT